MLSIFSTRIPGYRFIKSRSLQKSTKNRWQWVNSKNIVIDRGKEKFRDQTVKDFILAKPEAKKTASVRSSPLEAAPRRPLSF